MKSAPGVTLRGAFSIAAAAARGPLPEQTRGAAFHGHYAAHARLPAFAGTSGAWGGSLSLRRAGREVPRLRGRDRGQHPGARPSLPDEEDPGAGGNADARVEPLRVTAGRGAGAAAGGPD